ERSRVQLIHCVPALFRTLLGLDLTEVSFPALRHVLLAGEVVLPADVRAWSARLGDRIELVNLYGPSETTMTKFVYRIRPGDAERPRIPIGRPIPGAAALVVNDKGRPCAPGQVGEIVIRTPFRSHGYLNRPELTREVFVPNPFGDDPTDLVYRTGDLGRVLDDGHFEFLGRKDFQVKILGVRVELEEIESRLRDHPGVVEAVVRALDGDGGRTALCAYVVAGDLEPDKAELRRHLAPHLPAYMIPSHFVFLERLPRTTTGKVNHQALPKPTGGAATTDSRSLPRTPEQELLLAVWMEVLAVDGMGIHDSFFEWGGHSLIATQALSRVRRIFGVDMPLRDLFEAASVADFAVRLRGALALPGRDRGVIEATAEASEAPLSFAQQRLWFLDQIDPGSSAYNLPVGLEVAGRLDAEALGQALGEVCRRHAVLRSRFVLRDEAPVVLVEPDARCARRTVDLQRLDPADGRRECLRLAREEAARPFDLERGPLLRVRALRLRPEDHAILLTLHHIAGDGWSMGVLMREASELKRAFAEGRPSPLTELPIQYGDFARWQRRWLSGRRLDDEVELWRRLLAGAPPLLDLPTDRLRDGARGHAGGHHGFRIGAPLRASIAELGRRRGVTSFLVLLSAFAVVLQRYATQDDLTVGTPVANRDREEIEGLIGFFVNTLALRANLTGDPSFRDLLDRVRETVLSAFTHSHLPFEKLVEEIDPERSLSYAPLVQVLFAFQNLPEERPRLDDLEVRALEVETGSAKFDLTLTIRPDGTGYAADLGFRRALFEPTTVARIAQGLVSAVEGVVEDPGRELSALPLLTAAERHQVVREWNDTAARWEGPEGLDSWLGETARRVPEAVAVVSEQEHLSYGALAARAEALAARLRSLGVGPEVLVGVLAERSLELMVGLVAVLRAGGAYVPLDPEYPRERLRLMVEDSGAPVVLTQAGLEDRLPATAARRVRLDGYARSPAEAPAPALAP
ncbi:MAG TPA: condensation domain-containing protein, partial [Candidatus Limnocylindrales bacterium]|nr:condensation domain-containing protein [Candidatus Limnocylindrales bacterium]